MIQIKEIAARPNYGLRINAMEETMPVLDIVVLGFIIAAFVVFSATLAWASRSQPKAEEGRHRAHPTPHNAQHA